jgi:LacI family transcriptional regulator
VSTSERATMAEIAEQSGVSLSTVSLVLRDKAGVGVETRQRVLDVARELGYVARRPAAAHSPSISTVGLILKADPGSLPQANKFYSDVVAGIEMACRRRQVNLLYASMTVDQDSHPLELPRLLLEDGAAGGLLLLGAFLDEALVPVVERRATPLVLVDSYALVDRYDSVVSDNFGGAYQAVTYLIERGHRHIGLVGGHPQAYPSIQERQAGYQRALKDHGIAGRYVAECHIVDTDEIVAATAALLQGSPQVTALFGANDDVTITAMDAARELGRRLPDDLSVVGYDDIDLAECLSPPLTTMQVDKLGMGRLAVELLINRIEHPEANLVRAAIRPRLVERGSVRAIQNHDEEIR